MIEKKKKYIEQYRKDNKEKIRKQRIQWDFNNAEKIKKQQKDYHKEHVTEIKKYEKSYKKDHAEEIKKYKCNDTENRKKIYKKYHMTHKIKAKEYKVKKKYGITLEQCNDMFNKQEGKCKICGKHQDMLTKPLVIDHDHETGKVRGLLCDKCNRGLGHFDDNIISLLQAIEYLKTNM